MKLFIHAIFFFFFYVSSCVFSEADCHLGNNLHGSIDPAAAW